MLNFSDNLIQLRHQKKVTQEQLADFVGVTKASVSKWETRQSLPDILILPQLAAFFDISIDQLLGYQPLLSKAQIQKLYQDFIRDFSILPFEEVMQRTKVLVKKYYSCYPFLFQICCLWLNHFSLAETETRQIEILNDISDLCAHIISEGKDINICNDAIILNASIDLQLGKARQVIEQLEDLLNPNHLSKQSDCILIQAYQVIGDAKKADSFTQISMFSHLVSFVDSATQYLAIHSDSISVFEETVKRIEILIDAYQLKQLHPNSAAKFFYQTAFIYCLHGKNQKAIHYLKNYAACVLYLLKDQNLSKHGDAYFNLIHTWYEQLDSGVHAPRDKKIILNSCIASLEVPVFANLQSDIEFQNIKNTFLRKGELE